MSDQSTLTAIQVLLAVTLASGAALGLRRFLRRHFTALHSYAIWLLVPALPLASLIDLLMPETTLAIVPAHAPVVSREFIHSTSRSGGI